MATLVPNAFTRKALRLMGMGMGLGTMGPNLSFWMKRMGALF